MQLQSGYFSQRSVSLHVNSSNIHLPLQLKDWNAMANSSGFNSGINFRYTLSCLVLNLKFK